MSVEILEYLSDVEKEAEEIIEAATRVARKALADAHILGELEKKNSEEETKALSFQITEKLKIETKAELELIVRKTRQEIEALMTAAEGKISQASFTILERILP
ncbi:MAG: V-type ATPase subunit subunit G family protein [Ignavibacteria bacterium]|nr:V-type ATPase subunit subunit G family protein [Ignavibacteria bacterium]